MISYLFEIHNEEQGCHIISYIVKEYENIYGEILEKFSFNVLFSKWAIKIVKLSSPLSLCAFVRLLSFVFLYSPVT